MKKMNLFTPFSQNSGKRKNLREFCFALALFFVATTAFSKNDFKEGLKSNFNATKKIKTISQQRVISGTVTAKEDGLPLQDVTVLLNNGESGTITDANGKYSIAAKKGDKVLFTFIGFKDVEVIVGDNDLINASLEIDVTFLDEVVLVGYGRKEKSKVSTAIATIKGEDIEEDLQSGASFDRSLSGMVKGLKITQGSGKPGSGVDINIRGYTSPFSNSSNNPLFVIDGVPVQAKGGFTSSEFGYNPLNSINPNDIESVNILKDAAATSIYGSRGANGVVIIKTKSANGGDGSDLQVDVSVRSTFSKPINTLKYLDAKGYKNYVDAMMKSTIHHGNNSLQMGSLDWIRLQRALFALQDFGANPMPVNGKFFYDPSKAKYGNANTNWADEVYRKAAYTQEYNISLIGSKETVSYGLSLRYLDQEGLLKKDGYKQYNARLNFSFSPTEKWDIGVNANLGSTKNSTGYVSINRDINNILSARPDIGVYDKNGNFTGYNKREGEFTYRIINPFAQTTEHYGQAEGKTATGNIYVQYEILKDLKLRGALNIAHFMSEDNQFRDNRYGAFGVGVPILVNNISIAPPTGPSELTLMNSRDTNIVGDFTANYVKTFNNVHELDILAGVTKTREYSGVETNKYSGFEVSKLRFPQYAKKMERGSSIFQEHGLNSYIARINYDYDRRYNLTATARLDQSSKFAPSNRNAWFPSVAASWNIHNEKFVNKEKVNQLKLRLSYGNTGSTNVPSFTFIQKFTAKGLYNGKSAVGISSELSNPRATWEKTTEINAGLDFGFMHNRISGSIDAYTRRTKGALMPTPHNVDTGTESYTANLATIDNKGIEFDLNLGIIDKENFYWMAGFNISKNINKLVSFDQRGLGEEFLDNYEVGREINLIKGFVVEKIYKSSEEVKKANAEAVAKGHNRYDESTATIIYQGDYKMKDISGPEGKPDGRITRDDLKILGSTQPDFFGGFRTRLQYGNISLGASFNYSFGAEATRRSNPLRDASPLVNVEEQFAPKYRWSPENTDASLPRIGLNTANGRTSSANVYDASFVRLKNLRLGYRLPYFVMGNLGIRDINVYISWNNLYTWTKFPGLDPEAVSGGAFANSTSNSDPYPISKSFTVGFNMKF